jgi:predicted nucleic-acid-binding protein
VWVLRSVYGFPFLDISAAITALLNVNKVAVERPAVEAAIAFLDAGGDFADGLIAYEGDWLGGEIFFSLDKKPVALLTKQGHMARLLI